MVKIRKLYKIDFYICNYGKYSNFYIWDYCLNMHACLSAGAATTINNANRVGVFRKQYSADGREKARKNASKTAREKAGTKSNSSENVPNTDGFYAVVDGTAHPLPTRQYVDLVKQIFSYFFVTNARLYASSPDDKGVGGYIIRSLREKDILQKTEIVVPFSLYKNGEVVPYPSDRASLWLQIVNENKEPTDILCISPTTIARLGVSN